MARLDDGKSSLCSGGLYLVPFIFMFGPWWLSANLLVLIEFSFVLDPKNRGSMMMNTEI